MNALLLRWDRRYRILSYTRGSLWIVPFVAIPLAMIARRILDGIDAMRGWDLLELENQAAQSLLATVVTASLSFLVFTFTSLLVAIQVASGQLTPRIIATTLLRDNIVRYTVGLFIFTLVLTLGIG